VFFSDDDGRREAVSLDQTSRFVGLTEVEECLSQALDRAEILYPKEVLLEGTNEPFSAAISFGRLDERE
jgi:hypothetical protein